MKPELIKNFIESNFFNWDDLNNLIKNHPKHLIKFVNKDGGKELFDENILKQKEGATLNFTNTQTVKKEFQQLVDYFVLKQPILKNAKVWDVQIYASWGNELFSFVPHFDPAYNFILQCEGSCRWDVSHAFHEVLQPRDLIYIPKNWVHQCFPLSNRISLSFSFWGL
jgi:ribosomal protein L16 Arg81 hydroxylase